MKISHLKSLIENGNIHINADLGANSTITFSSCGFTSSVIDTDDNILIYYVCTYIYYLLIVNRRYLLFIEILLQHFQYMNEVAQLFAQKQLLSM